MKPEMHVALVRKGLDMQVVGVVDVLTDLQHERQRMSRAEVGCDNLGDLVADRVRDCARMPFPGVVALG